MQHTTPTSNDPASASASEGTAAVAADPVPPLAFSDAGGAAAWLKSLPIASIGQLYAAVIGQLRAMSQAEIAPRTRAGMAEVMREQVAQLHTELARRYAGKPQPAGEREQEALEQALAMWQVLWEQYSACLKPLLEGEPELAGVKSKILQRGLHVGKQLFLVHGLARRTPPASLWEELHAYYRLAEMLECAVMAVSDDLLPNAVGISCYSTYSHTLLLMLADPWAMSVKQIELTDRWLAMWARKVFPYVEQRETEGPLILVDLNGHRGATLVPGAPDHPADTIRFGYPAKLATSVRGRLKRLQTGSNPSELQLGHDCSVEQCTALLTHLDRHWYQLNRAATMAPTGVDLCAGGVAGAYFRVAGRTFDRRDPLGRLSFQGAQHLQTLGAVTDYDRGRDEAERIWAWEHWTGFYDAREGSLKRSETTQHRWSLDQLVAVREPQRVRLGHVVRVAESDGALEVGVRLWAQSAKAIPVRPMMTGTAEDPPIPSLLLAETEDERGCLLLPPRTFNPNRVLRTLDAGPERRFRLTRLVQRGADFERVAYEETT